MIVHDRCRRFIGETLVVRRIRTISATAFLTLFVTGCAPDWTSYVSQSTALTFVRRVGCVTGGEYAYPENISYRVVDLERVAGPTDAFDITVVTGLDATQVIRRHIVGRETVVAKESSVLRFRSDHPCVKQIEIPWSETKPFYFYAGAQELVGKNWTSFVYQVLAAGTAILLALLGFALCTSDPRKKDVDLFVFVNTISLLLGIVATVIFNGLLPWRAAQNLVEYYAWFDSLPQDRGKLLPLTIEQFDRLIAGPPHPSSLSRRTALVVSSPLVMLAIWAVANLSSIAAGAYALFASALTAKPSLEEPGQCLEAEIRTAVNQAVHGYGAQPLVVSSAPARSFDSIGGTGSEISDPGGPSANRAEAIAEIQRRVVEAGNVKSGWAAWRHETEAAAAATALQAEVTRAQAVVACIEEQTKAMAAMDTFLDAALKTQVRRDLANQNYESQTSDEQDRFSEAAHRRFLTFKRREKEQFLADRETLTAKHGLQAERVFKRERFALGQKRIESKIAEAHVGVAVARTAAGESPVAKEPRDKTTEAALLGLLITRKQKEIAEAEADGKDTAEQRLQLAEVNKLLELLASAVGEAHAKAD
jgi:hypothetical protein